MKMKRFFFLVFALFYSHATWAQTSVYVSVLPQKYFVERIGGQHVDVSVMVKAGHSPATYEPTPQQMAKLNQAAFYLRIGVPFENVWLPKLQRNYPKLMVIDAREGIGLQAMPDIETLLAEKHEHHDDAHHDDEDEHHEEDGHDDHEEGEHHDEDNHDDHEEGDHHGHHHGEFDPHIWLDPNLVKVMAKQILQQLIKYDPEHQADYQHNYTQLVADLTQLDTYIKTTLNNIQDRKFLVFHPSWGYFANAYGLIQIPIEIEGKSPNSKDLARLIQYAKQQHIKAIFVQKQFSQKAARAVANATDTQLLVVDPLAESYIANLEDVTQVFVKAMK